MEKKSTVQENMSEENERMATAHRTVKMRRLKNFGEDNSARHIIMVIASMLCFLSYGLFFPDFKSLPDFYPNRKSFFHC